MKVFRYTIESALFFGDDDDTKDTIKDEIASRLNISSSDVYIETEEYVEE